MVRAFKVPADIRTIFVIGRISDEGTAEFIATFIGLERKSKAPIRIVLCAEGGTERAGWAMYDIIRQSPNKVIIDVVGECFSMAVPLLLAGDYRRMSKQSRLMVHAGSISLEENTDQRTFIAIGDELKKSNARYQAVVAERTGQDIDTIRAWCDQETYFSPEEALEVGFVDEIVTYAIGSGKRKNP